MTLLNNKNFVTGVVMLSVGLVTLFLLIPLGVDEPKKIKYAALSPSYYPRIIATGLCLLGLVIAIQSYWSYLSETPQEEDRNDENRPDATQRITIVFGLLTAMALTLTTFGFVLVAALGLGAAIRFAGERNYLLIASMAIIIPLALYFFFQKVAGIPIPLGILQPLLGGA